MKILIEVELVFVKTDDMHSDFISMEAIGTYNGQEFQIAQDYLSRTDCPEEWEREIKCILNENSKDLIDKFFEKKDH